MGTALLESNPRIGNSRYTGLGRPRPPAEVPFRASRRPGVLLAEEDVLGRVLLGAGLEEEGFAVWAASNGYEALELYGRHAGEIDLVLLDVCLPGLDGPQTLASLRRLNPGVHCCFLSGQTCSYTEEELLDLGTAEVLPKTFRAAKLAPVLRRLLGHPQPSPQQSRGGLAVLCGWLWGRGEPASTRHPAAAAHAG